MEDFAIAIGWFVLYFHIPWVYCAKKAKEACNSSYASDFVWVLLTFVKKLTGICASKKKVSTLTKSKFEYKIIRYYGICKDYMKLLKNWTLYSVIFHFQLFIIKCTFFSTVFTEEIAWKVSIPLLHSRQMGCTVKHCSQATPCAQMLCWKPSPSNRSLYYKFKSQFNLRVITDEGWNSSQSSGRVPVLNVSIHRPPQNSGFPKIVR